MALRMAGWVLNLDAELELAGRTASRALAARLHVESRRGEALFAPGDVRAEAEAGRGRPGRCWCPTPRALATLRSHGWRPVPSPPFPVLRRVNHRRFCAELGQTLPGARFVGTYEEARDALARPGRWRVKRAFGVAGRDQRTDPDDAWLRASFPEGLQIEPELRIRRELSIHGLLEGDSLRLGRIVQQQHADAWGTCVPATVSAETGRHVRREAERVAGALRSAGYFGPFGVDAIEHEEGLQPRSEINARYTMGWPLGMLEVERTS